MESMHTGENGPVRWYVVVGHALLQAAEHYQRCGRNEGLAAASQHSTAGTAAG